MNITESFPRYIQFASAELALTFAYILSANGYTIDANMAANTCIEYMSEPFKTIVHIRDKHVSRHSDGSTSIPTTPFISSISALIVFMKRPVIKVGEHVAEFNDAGVKVGCTFVPWDVVQKIAAKAPKPATTF